MKYFYYFLVGVLSLAALYNIFGIVYFKWSYFQLENPKENFMIIDSKENNLTIVDFTNYQCKFCRGMHKTISESLELNKDIRYIIRPILLTTDATETDNTNKTIELERLAIAAGFQGKFKEFHDAFMEYPQIIIPEDFTKETADLYGVDYDRLIQDSQSQKTQKILIDNMDDMLGMNVKTIPSYIINKTIYAVGDTLPSLTNFMTMITNERKKK